MTAGTDGPNGGDQATDLVEALRGYIQLPGVQLAGLSALIGAGVVLAAGLLLAIVMPDASLVDLSDDGAAGLLQETLNQACGTTLALFDIDFLSGALSLRPSPLLFAVFPIGGCALGSYLLSGRAIELSTRPRLVWGAATAVPFALLMLVMSLLAGTTENEGSGFSPAEGSVLLMALLWGAIGGLVGAALALRRDGVGVILPSRVELARRLARATLVPLALALTVTMVVGTGVWLLQTVRDTSGARAGRSLPTALADDVFFAGDYGLRYLALGTGAQFHAFDDTLLRASVSDGSDAGDISSATEADFLPIPLSPSHVSELLDAEDSSTLNPDFTLFSYGDVLPAWLYAPLLLILIITPAFFALSGGFGVARAVGPATAAIGAAWGALVGPVWAVVAAILNALTQEIFFGQILGDSFFAIVLIAGAALGALGGVVATQQVGGQRPPTPAA